MTAGPVAAELTRIERDLDPARPEASGLSVLAYGEISATLRIHGDDFAGIVAKRMSGFPDAASASDYAGLVRCYCDTLKAVGLQVAPTEPLVIERPQRPPVVYLLQPLAPEPSLGNRLLHTASDDELRELVAAVLQLVDRALAGGSDGLQVAIDAQLSNFSVDGGALTLLDVGTPFLRRGGEDLLDMRVMLAAVPPGVRAVYLHRRIGERYIDDYFDRRLVAVDLLGNFIKEAASARLPVGLAAVNAWLGAARPVTGAEVARYYRQDARTLELFLRVRRADRWIRTRLLGRPYDFILPGDVTR
jgi:hypothetical protein